MEPCEGTHSSEVPGSGENGGTQKVWKLKRACVCMCVNVVCKPKSVIKVADGSAIKYTKHEDRRRGRVTQGAKAGAVSYTHLDVYKRQIITHY